ncbi:MAG: peptidoglycan-binding protein [Candidatus Taylorbacteria bacterium]|nr:peptidoglycan-binding protein [Candidatus Taylorbacteria bacterium]
MKKYIIFILVVVVLFSSKYSSATKPSDFGLKEGDLISAIFSDDPDVYIINENGFKRLFLNPEIFKFYSHLGGFANIKLVTPEIRDSFPTSGFFRNCEDNDQKVFGTSVEGEDTGRLHWINKSGDQAVQEDPDFFKKVFCINRKEFNWYPRGNEFKELREVPQYHRTEEVENYVICHRPSDDPSTLQTIRVAPESLDAHFQHGDSKGACPTYSLPIPQEVPTTTPTQPAELCYNCPSPVTLSPSNECRTFSYYGEDFYIQDAFLNLLRDKGVKITGTPSGSAWSTRLSGTLGDTKEVVGFISPDRSEADLGVSDNETLIIELTNEFAQIVEIGLTVMPSATSNNIPVTVSVTALNQMGDTLAGEKRTFTGVTDNKLTPAVFVLKASKSEISKIIIQTSQHPSGGVWLQSVGATNACTTVSTSVPSYTSIPTPLPTSTATLPPSITVVTPNGGEAWQKGTTQLIEWKSADVNKVYIKLRKGNDTYPGTEGKVSDIISTIGGYKWTIPMTLPDGNDYSVRVIDGNFTGVFDDSDKPFSISLAGVVNLVSTPTPTPTYSPTPTPISSATYIYDLAVVDIIPNPSIPEANKDFTVDVALKNVGQKPISNPTTMLAIYDANGNKLYDPATGYIGIVNPGATIAVRFYSDMFSPRLTETTLNFPAGTYKMVGAINYLGVVDGINYPKDPYPNNDTFTKTLEIKSTLTSSPTPNTNCYVKIDGVVVKSVYATDRNSCYSQTSFGSANCNYYTSYFTAGTHFLEQYFGATDRVNNEYCTCQGGVCKQGATSSLPSSSSSYPIYSKNLAIFSRNLTVGSVGNDVKQLQALLANEVGYSADLITGYFGRITRDAVIRLQEKYGIKPTYGYFGAITRKALNALISN